MTVEERFSQLSKIEGILAIIGALCFVTAVSFSIVHLGFVNEVQHHTKPFQFLTREQLWLINLGLGLLGGVLTDLRRFIIAGISGLIAVAGITGFAIFYLSWRADFMSLEIIIIICIGMIPGLFLYNSLKKQFYARH